MTFDEAVQVFQEMNPGVPVTPDAFNAWSGSIGDFENVTAEQVRAGGLPSAAQPTAPAGTATTQVTAESLPQPSADTTKFDVYAYLRARPDLINNWNGDPRYAKQYDSLENYALADATANGPPDAKAKIESGAIIVPANFEQVGGTTRTTTNVPAEQGGFEAVRPAITDLLSRYEQDRGTANQLAATTLAGSTAATNILQSTQGGGFDSQDYLTRYPNIQQLFDGLNQGTAPGTKAVPTPAGAQDMTAPQFAEFHYKNFGQKEGLTANYVPSSRLASTLSNIETTTGKNVAAANTALETTLDSLKKTADAAAASLTGELAVRAKGLSDEIASLQANAGTLDAAQLKALTDSIAAQQAALEKSITGQKDALTQQVKDLTIASGAQTDLQRKSLKQELTDLTNVVGYQAQERRTALQGQIDALDSAATKQSGAQRASLQQELAGLQGAVGAQAEARRAALQQQIASLSTAATSQADARRGAL